MPKQNTSNVTEAKRRRLSFGRASVIDLSCWIQSRPRPINNLLFVEKGGDIMKQSTVALGRVRDSSLKTYGILKGDICFVTLDGRAKRGKLAAAMLERERVLHISVSFVESLLGSDASAVVILGRVVRVKRAGRRIKVRGV